MITNPSFESGATTDGNGNQVALGWAAFAPAKSAMLPYDSKNQQGKLVTAVSDGPGQFILRQANQVAEDEVPGQPRAVILDGSTSYLITGPAGAHALRLTQTLSGAPGTKVRVTAYVLGETSDRPGGEATKLEDDHFVASLGLGELLDKRQYAQMIVRFDAVGNTRPWNRFVVEATFPAQGQLVLTLIMQQNWAGNTFFYLDSLSLEVLP
ncbi:MAG: hypothetical protein HY784_18305 [Chloroflexi bacterium]|nr:hypothetical protein [Chloroflexota bacterium]